MRTCSELKCNIEISEIGTLANHLAWFKSIVVKKLSITQWSLRHNHRYIFTQYTNIRINPLYVEFIYNLIEMLDPNTSEYSTVSCLEFMALAH